MRTLRNIKSTWFANSIRGSLVLVLIFLASPHALARSHSTTEITEAVLFDLNQCGTSISYERETGTWSCFMPHRNLRLFDNLSTTLMDSGLRSLQISHTPEVKFSSSTCNVTVFGATTGIQVDVTLLEGKPQPCLSSAQAYFKRTGQNKIGFVLSLKRS